MYILLKIFIFLARLTKWRNILCGFDTDFPEFFVEENSFKAFFSRTKLSNKTIKSVYPPENDKNIYNVKHNSVVWNFLQINLYWWIDELEIDEIDVRFFDILYSKSTSYFIRNAEEKNLSIK